MISSGNTLPLLVTAVFAVAGISLGIGLKTFDYAEGTSYFSKDPAACANCHIMRPQLASWQKSSHKALATCVDCHLPHDPLGKYLAKAENGWNHSKAFTLQNFHEPIQINDKNSRILQDNCVHCHGALTHAMTTAESVAAPVTTAPGGFSCVHCHRDVGHGERATMGVLETNPGRAGLKRLVQAVKAESSRPSR